MFSVPGPDFVGAVEDEDFVYFFFREEAVEFMNCGKVSLKKF
jgi:semaphorin 5